MNSIAVEVEVDLPEGVRIRGYGRYQGAHAFEVDFDLPSHCRCSKCGHEAEANVRYKDQTLVIRDLDLLGQPSFWVYQPPMHQCPRCRQRTQIPTPFKRPHVTYTSRFEQWVLEQLVGASVEEVARRLSVSAEMIEDILEYPIGRRTRDLARARRHQPGLRRAEPEEAAQIVRDGDERPVRSEAPAGVGRGEGARSRRDRGLSGETLAPAACRGSFASHGHERGNPQVRAEWLPESQLVVDRFHVAKHLAAIVDRQRKKHGVTS